MLFFLWEADGAADMERTEEEKRPEWGKDSRRRFPESGSDTDGKGGSFRTTVGKAAVFFGPFRRAGFRKSTALPCAGAAAGRMRRWRRHLRRGESRGRGAWREGKRGSDLR